MKAVIIIFFSPNFSMSIPEGMDITPYAMKNAKGRMATIVRLRVKPFIISGISGPIIFVRNDITKNVSMISPTM
jgi:hypothetical protein